VKGLGPTGRSRLDQPSALGESPFWHPHEQMLYWVDIPGRAMPARQCLHGHGAELGDADGAGLHRARRGGGLVMALRDGIYRAREWGGPLTLLARFDHDPPPCGSTTARPTRMGRFWAGTYV
jgi:sugar lactone lactonase YvrE